MVLVFLRNISFSGTEHPQLAAAERIGSLPLQRRERTLKMNIDSTFGGVRQQPLNQGSFKEREPGQAKDILPKVCHLYFYFSEHRGLVDHSDQKAQWLVPRNRTFGKSHF
jgi:hypothetical protein